MAKPVCKVTVLKKTLNKDYAEKYMKDELVICEVFSDGQEFFIEDPFTMPKEFCNWAWSDLRSNILTLSCGGKFPWMKDPNSIISCCSDGLRPVYFKVEGLVD